jgi:hypothetical protein
VLFRSSISTISIPPRESLGRPFRAAVSSLLAVQQVCEPSGRVSLHFGHRVRVGFINSIALCPSFAATTCGDSTTDVLATWLADVKDARLIPSRMKTAGYAPHQNKNAKDGLWKIDGRRQVVYVQKELSEQERQTAALVLNT